MLFKSIGHYRRKWSSENKIGFVSPERRYELSTYFQNKNQMNPYISGDGYISENLERLEANLQSYIAQVEPDARVVPNKNF